MKPIKILQVSIILLTSSVLLTGCMSPGRNVIPSQGAMTMPEIYKRETGQDMTNNTNPRYEYNREFVDENHTEQLPTPDYSAYTATGVRQINNLFKRLPNPEIPMYIYPHLVELNGESYPKPGITTAFFLYKQNHFAMPNEEY